MREGWEIRNIEECIDHVKYPNKVPKKSFLEEGQFPIISQEQDYINGYWSNEEDLLRLEKPVVIFGDHTKVLKFIDFDFVLGADGVKVLQPKDFLDPKFFYYFLNAFPVKALGYARHYRLLKELEVQFPRSLPEQKRIVAILDEAFEGIDHTVTNVEKNFTNARELFDSYLNKVFAQQGDGWNTKSIGELCDILDSKRKPVTKKDRISGEYPYYGATGVLDYVEDYIFDEKLILIGEDGAKWGAGENTAFTAEGKYWVNNHAHVIRPHREIVLDPWVIYYLNANDLSLFITGLTVPKLNQGKLRDIPIPLPPLPEQKRIVAILDGLSAKTKSLKIIYQRKLTALAELKQSLLQKAFAGELTKDAILTKKDAAA